LPRMMGLGAAIAVVSSVAGLFASRATGIPAGAAIVLTATVLFGAAWLLRPALKTN